MCWRGEYVRKMRNRYNFTNAQYANFSNRASAFSQRTLAISRVGGSDLSTISGDDVTPEQQQRRIVVVSITPLVACALAAMGFAPILPRASDYSRCYDVWIRCHRCFTRILVADKSDESWRRYLDGDDEEDGLEVAYPSEYTFECKVQLLNRIFRALNALHGESNPFCPYVRISYDKFKKASSRHMHKYRNLILYTTRFNLPGYDGRRGVYYMWNYIPTSPKEDALFRIFVDDGDNDNGGDRKIATRHVLCVKYANERTLVQTRNDKIVVDRNVDARYDVLVNARPLATYRRAIEFVDAKDLYPANDRTYDRSVDLICAHLRRLDQWNRERLGIVVTADDSATDVATAPLFEISNDYGEKYAKASSSYLDVSDGDDSEYETKVCDVF